MSKNAGFWNPAYRILPTKVDTVTISDFHVDTIIGVHDWEQQQTQSLILNLALHCDCQLAADTDDLNHALDYFALTEHLKTYLSQSRFSLIEALAHQLTVEIFKQFPLVKAIDIHIQKPEAINNALVGVKLNRSR